MFKKRFTDYASYAQATIEDILTPTELEQSQVLTAYQFETMYFENTNGSFVPKKLPTAMQFAPVFALATADVNQDGHLDIISGGNLDNMRARFGKATGNFGTVLLGNGQGDFSVMPPVQSGLTVRGETRQIITNNDQFTFIRNNAPPLLYQLRP